MWPTIVGRRACIQGIVFFFVVGCRWLPLLLVRWVLSACGLAWSARLLWKSSSVPLQSFVSVCFAQLQPQHLCNLRLAIQTYWALVAKFRSQFESKVRDVHHVRFPETDEGHEVAHCWPTTGWRRVHGPGCLQEGRLLELRVRGLVAINGYRLIRISDFVAFCESSATVSLIH